MGLSASRYNFVRRLDGRRAAVYNAWTDALIAVPVDILDIVDRGDWRALPPFWSARLLRDGIVVPSAIDECARAMDRVRTHLAGRALQVIAVPTWRCNLRCPYCYEPAQARRGAATKRHWAAAVATFIGEQLARGGPTPVAFALFGGEPLLNPSACADVLEGVQDAASHAGVPRQLTLTTNGSIINPAVRRVLALVDSVQVSIDGGPGDHDRLRVGPNARPTFDAIVDFVVSARDAGTRPVIRYHLHPGAEDRAQPAAAAILQRLGDDRDVMVYFAQVSCGSYVGAMGGCDTDARHIDIAAHARARDAFVAAGWRPEAVQLAEKVTSERLPCAVRCGYLNRRTFLIDPALDVYFCPVAIRDPALRAGVLDTEGQVRLEPAFERLVAGERLAGECRTCAYLPLCEGGCPARSALTKGAMDAACCDRARIDAIVDHNARYPGEMS